MRFLSEASLTVKFSSHGEKKEPVVLLWEECVLKVMTGLFPKLVMFYILPNCPTHMFYSFMVFLCVMPYHAISTRIVTST